MGDEDLLSQMECKAGKRGCVLDFILLRVARFLIVLKRL